MNLQDWFYVVAIIFMIINIILFLTAVIALWYIKNKITQIREDLAENIENWMVKPAETAMNIGAAVASIAIKRVKKLINRK